MFIAIVLGTAHYFDRWDDWMAYWKTAKLRELDAVVTRSGRLPL